MDKKETEEEKNNSIDAFVQSERKQQTGIYTKRNENMLYSCTYVRGPPI